MKENGHTFATPAISSSDYLTQTETSNTTVINPNDKIFFETIAARGISGVFVWLALLITGHQVRKTNKINQLCS